MRWALYIIGAALIVVASFWSYSVTYATQARLDEIAKLNRKIAIEREAIRVLAADWAWLNAPDRLARLVAAHNDVLKLEPMEPERFAEVAEAPLKQPDDGLAPVALIDLDAVSPEDPVSRRPRRAAPAKPQAIITAETREEPPRRAAPPRVVATAAAPSRPVVATNTTTSTAAARASARLAPIRRDAAESER